MRFVVIVLLAIFSSGSSCGQAHPNNSSDVGEPSQGTQLPFVRLFGVLHSEDACRALQEQAYESKCINEKGLRAMRVLKVAPICTANNEFSHWEPCEHQAQREIRQILEQTEVCGKDNLVGNCALEEVEFHPRQKANDSSRGQRILIIDENLEKIGVWRYVPRVIEVVVPNEEGEFRSTSIETQMPKAMKIITELLANKYHWISPKSFMSLEYSKKFPAFLQGYPASHGFPVFNHLAEYNPKAEFVLAPLKLNPPLEDLCASEIDTEALKRIRSYVRKMGSSLAAVVKKHEINYINMSFGKQLDQIIDPKRPECSIRLSKKRLQDIVKIYLEEFFWRLSTLEDVVVVQAGAESPYPLQAFDIATETLRASILEQFPFATKRQDAEEVLFDYGNLGAKNANFLTDCVQFPNHLRVGRFDLIKPNISSEGTNELNLIDDDYPRNAHQCIDIYINEGAKIEHSTKIEIPRKEDWSFSLWRSANGIAAEPIIVSGSSNVAPVAISYLIQLKRMNPELTPQQLLEKAKSGGKLKDPLRHELHLFNVFGSDDFCDVGACDEESPAIKKNNASGRVDAVFIDAQARIEKGFRSIEKQIEWQNF